MKRISITGHMGFIGSVLQKKIEEKYKGEKVFIEKFDIKENSDILKISLPESDVIIHLSAQADVQESIKDPMYDAMNNIIGSMKIMLENPSAKIVIASSVAIKDPQSPYGISKLAVEHYSSVIHKNAVVCRFPNVFGLNGKGVVSKFIENDEITIFGDGEQSRDFVSVDDIADGLIQAMEWEAGIYEFGSEKNYTVNDLAKATGKKIIKEKALEGEIRESICKNTTPDWKPKDDVCKFIKDNC